MFIFRYATTSYIACVGMDYVNKAMFTVCLYSPDDNVQLDFNTGHYPEQLIQYLKKEKSKIDSGFYSIRTWNMNLYNED